ncbi:MAG: class I SAM-dependent methyltransferase [Saprospiraceae bacterium]|nr:class I SAM-dependent methyltransferase [Saprospiraceae bacterium]
MKKLMKFLVRNIPRQTLIKFSFLFSKLISVFYIGNKVECPICESKFRKFLPWGNKGAENRLCPNCLSLERHRLIWLYLKNKTDFFTASLKVLHVAPEQPFYKRFRALKNLDYTTADLDSPIADIKVDIMNMQFEDNTYDVFICNHVLEHVDNDIHAMKEIHRILKPGGWAILQVPINFNSKETYEDPSITDPKEREKHFGQYDHLRYHGLDYGDRLRKGGFTVVEEDYVNEFPPDIIERYRLQKEEILYLCKKI